MADDAPSSENEKESESPTADDKVIVAALIDRLKLAQEFLDDSRRVELDDLKFHSGTPDNRYQWPAEVLSERALQTEGLSPRPTLTINKLPQHTRQITNDFRQNRPGGKVVPVDDKGDVKVAEIFDGMVRSIEVSSNAALAYNTANENQVIFGEGYWRIVTEYCDDTSFDQELFIRRIRNSFSVYMDPMINDPCGEDAEWCILTEDIAHTEYERLWPNASKVATLKSEGVNDPNWLGDKTIRIAEYFYKQYDPATLALWSDGNTTFVGTKEHTAAKLVWGKPVKTRQVMRPTVQWVKSNGYEILERTTWLGKYIPVIRAVGNETEIEGKLEVSGHTRNAKDAQRMYNYWTSQEAEMLALQPKAPFVGYKGQFKDKKWQTANTRAWPYLEVDPTVTDAKGAVLPHPERAQPPLAQTGLLQAKLGASEDIKASLGQYDASLGQVSNERSGKAIVERQRQSDTGAYHYFDNMSMAQRYSTKQLIDLIPKIYDTKRVARTIGIDGEVGMAHLDPEQEAAVVEIQNDLGAIQKIYNPKVGKYDVVPSTGPSYETKRQEARESMGEALQANPELWKVAGDLFMKNMDWPGAQEFAKRLKKAIPPELLVEDDNPAMTAAQKQIQQMGQEMEAMHQMLNNVQQSFDAREVAVKEYEAQTDRINVLLDSMTGENALTPEKVQDIVMGTIHSMIASGDLPSPTPSTAVPA